MEIDMDEKQKDYVYKRNRSTAVVVRDGKILMEKVFYFGYYFYTVPGGGIEDGETPENAALRELKEETGLEGTIVRPLSVQYKLNGAAEYAFEVNIPENQNPIKGYDPEEAADNQPIKEVCWMALKDIPERDRAFLWSYGLITVGEFYEELRSWGGQISYPDMP